ncbi:SDR family NAD(P)-dependent oxidoreductase [Chitinimonas koreensis]|nr:SDR family NAD(P)-dependent oxidoreductase [Chitinimonas koreensis]
MPYVALQLLAEQGASLGRFPAGLREVVTAGEQLLCTDAIRRWFGGLAGARLFNHYGPTETHVVSSLCLAGDPAHWPARPSIGRPIANAWLRVVDEADLPLPPGCPGHLLAGGPMAAPCYLGDAALNAARFVELADAGGQSHTFYRTGDRACFDRDGQLHYLGRDDQQVKLSGHRLELGQVEAALLLHPAVVNAVVAKDGEQLVACLQCRDGAAVSSEALQAHLAPLLPAYVRIARFRLLAQMPRTASGKLDRRAVLQAPGEELRPPAAAAPAMSALEARLAALFEAVVGKPVAPEQSFFDAGAGSLGLMRFHLRCTAELGLSLAIADLFEHVSIRRLARFLTERPAAQAADAARAATATTGDPAVAGEPGPDEPIAIVGMAVNLPGAADLAAFWEMVLAGGRGIVHFDAAEGLVGARSQMAGMLAFDPEHFGISRQEARLMDPQQRQLLMSCVQALAHAGITDAGGRRIGLVASCGENTYFQAMLREADPARLPDGFQLALHHDKDFLATKAAYHLDLRGPALTVQAACASSLIAVHVAAGMLRQGDAEAMLAAGVLVDPYLAGGYRYRPQHIFSRDGHCRPFSDDASGTIGGSGAGVVVLKPLRLARRDGDTVYALVAGSALNNDGAGKLSYTAPSLAGQREAIRAALRRGGLAGADVGYVEAHGTGTQLGDPVEVGALRQAYLDESAAADAVSEPHCALASVKSQIGHLGAAAGVVGLVRAALAVHHGRIPPNVDFGRPNPRIGELAPFYVPTAAQPWPAGRRRVAAVSSFGIGGTNAHLLLAQAEPAASPAVAAPPCLLLSASSEAALRLDAGRIADFLAAQPAAYGQVLRHLQAGRPPRRWRMAAVCRDAAAAVAWLRGAQGKPVEPAEAPAESAEALQPEALVAAWLAGRALDWPAGPAQAPWDFPPPAFALADYDFERAAPAAAVAAAAGVAAPAAETADPDWPLRQVAERWLYQPQWTRLRRAPQRSAAPSPRLVVALLAQPLAPAPLQSLAAGGRLVQVIAGQGFARLADDRYTVDPADAESLRRLWAALEVGEAGADWLHALPLSIDGAVGEAALAQAQWACVDTAAALLQAVAATPAARALRIWWLSSQAQPVDGVVARPEPGLLAGAASLAQQECAIASHWLDLPGGDWAGWLPALAALLAEADAAALPQRLALRHGYLWQAAHLPVAAPAVAAPAIAAAGVHLVLGGTGGIGASLAAELLERGAERVILLARRAGLPESLARWADRIALLELDLAAMPLDQALARIAEITDRLDGVVHAAGVAAGSLIARRDAAAMGQGVRAKLHGALLVEGLIARYRPGWAVYCSSMAALFGGVGQLDYAAANGLLDGFAQYRAGSAETTQRIGIDWDIWREVGMARQALQSDKQHQAHLAVGLSVAEGRRVFAQALRLQLPQLLVSTTAIDQAPAFYAPPARPDAPPAEAAPADSAGQQLAQCLCRWLGLERLDPDASLYDLGADSLTLLDLIGEVQQRFGVEIALSQLSHKASLAEVLALLAPAAPAVEKAAAGVPAAGAPAAGAPAVSLEIWQQGSGSDLLCLVHPVGGDIQAYRALVARLDPRWTVCLIADPALRQAGLPAWPLEERARLYHAALRQRFAPADWQWHLAGWSFGAWVALAMAAEAETAGTAAAALYLLDPPPPGSGPRFQDYTAAEVEAVFAHELGQRAGEDGGAEAARYREGLTRCCLANLASMARYELPRLAHTASHVWIAREPVAGLPAPLGSPEAQRQRWQKHLAQLASWHGVDTTHYGLVRPPHAAAVAGFIDSASVSVQAAC